jgi:hypothetical protein
MISAHNGSGRRGSWFPVAGSEISASPRSKMIVPRSAQGGRRARASFSAGDSRPMQRRRAVGSSVMAISTVSRVSVRASPTSALERDAAIAQRWVPSLRGPDRRWQLG